MSDLGSRLNARCQDQLAELQWRHGPPTHPHAVYDTLDHLLWSPKYRHDVLQGEVQQRVQELFADMAEPYDIRIEEMEVSSDHIHIIKKVGRRLEEGKKR